MAGWSDFGTVRTFATTANKMGAVGKLGVKLALLESDGAMALAGIVLFYCMGFAILSHFDTKSKGLNSGLISTIVFLYAMVDALHQQFPDTRMPVVLAAFASGMANAVSARKTQLTTHMLTIHLHCITQTILDSRRKISSQRLRKTQYRIQVCLCLAAGAAVGATILYSSDNVFSSTSGHSFALVGLMYGLVLFAYDNEVLISSSKHM